MDGDSGVSKYKGKICDIDFAQNDLNVLHSSLLFNTNLAPSFFAHFATPTKRPVKKEIVGCDHQLGVYIETKDGRFIKIQVKSTTLVTNSKYSAGIAYGTKVKDCYSSDDVDYFAIYLIPEDVWYVIPHSDTNGMKRLKLSPDGSCKLGSFRENWGFGEVI